MIHNLHAKLLMLWWNHCEVNADTNFCFEKLETTFPIKTKYDFVILFYGASCENISSDWKKKEIIVPAWTLHCCDGSTTNIKL